MPITDVKLTKTGFTWRQRKLYWVNYHVQLFDNDVVVLERDIQGELSVKEEGVIDPDALTYLQVHDLEPQLKALWDEYDRDEFMRTSIELATVAESAAIVVVEARK